MKADIPIMGTVIPHLHRVQVERLQRIDDEDFGPTRRKTVEYFNEIGKSFDEDYLVEGIYALKQYYAIALLDPANAHAVSLPVDPFWHSHILHTERYMRFCDEVVGEYMHHRPLDHERKDHVQVVRRLYGHTLRVMPLVFNRVNQVFWPSRVPDEQIICWHKGNQTMYQEAQPHRLFPPVLEGVGYEP